MYQWDFTPVLAHSGILAAGLVNTLKLTGTALALGIPGEGLMGLFGPKGAFVGGNGALAFLLLAEVAAADGSVETVAGGTLQRRRH